MLEIYCDGACIKNPGRGGWASILLYDTQKHIIVGCVEKTTNNRMELTAALMGLKAITTLKKKINSISVHTDSLYVKNGITIWIESWEKTAWKDGTIKNIDLWKELRSLDKIYNAQWFWVKGHSGHALNDEVDRLARNAALGMNAG